MHLNTQMDFWLCLVAFVSAKCALYCTVMFYMAMEEELEDSMRTPLGKFMSVGAVVFFCFVQGVILRVSSFLSMSSVPEFNTPGLPSLCSFF